MTKFRDHIIMTAVFVTLGLIGMFMSAHQVTAALPATAGPNMTISGPLPLPVTVGNAITIGNADSAPVPVRQVGVPTRQPVTLHASVREQDGSYSDEGYFVTVPAGKRLVVEDATASLSLPSGQKALVTLDILESNVFVSERELTVTFKVTEPKNVPVEDLYGAGEPVHIYVEAGQTLGTHLLRSGLSGFGGMDATITGYYEDVP